MPIDSGNDGRSNASACARICARRSTAPATTTPRMRRTILYQLAENFNVTLDVEGAWSAVLRAHQPLARQPVALRDRRRRSLVSEITTRDPTRKLDAAVFIPEAPFPSPLTYTYATTHGADLNWVPMPFADRLRLAHSRTFYGTGYYIYHQFVPGLALSRALTSWNAARHSGARRTGSVGECRFRPGGGRREARRNGARCAPRRGRSASCATVRRPSTTSKCRRRRRARSSSAACDCGSPGTIASTRPWTRRSTCCSAPVRCTTPTAASGS